MIRTIYPLMAAFILLTSVTLIIQPQSFQVGEGHSIEFKSKDPSGVFKHLEGDISFDANNLSNSKINFSINVSSISTGNGMQNKKAQTEEWFYASKYPQIKFKSTKITESDGIYYVYGELTMRGVTKDYKVLMKTENVSNGLILKGNFDVKRSDFKIGKPSDVVPDIMKISYSIPIYKK